MSKTNKQKYYAIKDGKGVKDKIVTTWAECKKLVLHYPAIYKSFLTEIEAKEYLKNINQENIQEIKINNKKAMEYNKSRKKGTKPIVGLRIDEKTFGKFQEKCDEFNLDMKEAIIKMIEEWVV